MSEARQGGQSRFQDGFRILQGNRENITYIEHASIRIWYSETPSYFEAHLHSAVEIICPYRGVATYELQERVYHVKPGEILILPAECLHRLREPEDIQRHLILYEPSPFSQFLDLHAVSNLLRKVIYLNQNSPGYERIHDCIARTIEAYNRKEFLWNTQCYANLLEMYAVLGQNDESRDKDMAQGPQLPIDSEIMNSAMTYINQHFAEDISLETVAGFTGFSKSYFSRNFKLFFDIGFLDYLSQKRVSEATSLLTHTAMSMQEIAATTGFGSVATFNRAFKKIANCTPSQYRALYGVASPRAVKNPIF